MEIPRSNWTLTDDEDVENERSVRVLALRQKLAENVTQRLSRSETMHLIHINGRTIELTYTLPHFNAMSRDEGAIQIITENGNDVRWQSWGVRQAPFEILVGLIRESRALREKATADEEG